MKGQCSLITSSCECIQPTRNSADSCKNQEMSIISSDKYIETVNPIVAFTFFKETMIRLPVEPDSNLLSFVFTAQWGWMDRCVTFAQNRWGVGLWTLLSNTFIAERLWGATLHADTTEWRKICSVGMPLHPDFYQCSLFLDLLFAFFEHVFCKT